MKTLVANKLGTGMSDIFKAKIRNKSAETDFSKIYPGIDEKPIATMLPFPAGCKRLFFDKVDEFGEETYSANYQILYQKHGLVNKSEFVAYA